MPKPKLMIVDDDEDIRSQMRWALATDYDVRLAEDRTEAVQVFKESRPAVVLLDLGLPPHPQDTTEGFATLSELLSLDRSTKIIIISGQSDRKNALRAVGEGAYDFFYKPIQIEELKIVLKRTYDVARLEKEFREAQFRLGGEGFHGMLGTSPQMQAVFGDIRKVARSEASVLILGESGTGKEMTALAIHHQSERRDGPFVPINCSAIPENLLESELFGHEKGSFTGAHAQRKGRFEMAEKGTLFLDEIGELPPQLQVKLLRFLQEQTIERVGGRTPIAIDARVVAATHVDLEKARLEGRFREDLFYRLAVVVLRLPALRERSKDLPVLAQAFLQKCSAESGKQPKLTSDALTALEHYAWPGNVRELENRMRRAVIMSNGRQITAEDLELAAPKSMPAVRTLKEARDQLEREMLREAIQRHQGKISAAAEELGVSRPTFYELMEKHGLPKQSFASS